MVRVRLGHRIQAGVVIMGDVSDQAAKEMGDYLAKQKRLRQESQKEKK